VGYSDILNVHLMCLKAGLSTFYGVNLLPSFGEPLGVPGLCAKPIIDIVAVMGSYDVFPEIVVRLEKVGYEHEGDGSIKE